MTTPAATIAEALDDPALLGAAFQGPSWDAWRAILRAAYALPMTQREVELFRALAERDPPTRQVRELVIIAGRRAGKDSIASVIAAHAGAFRDYRPLLRPGERATIACLACDRDQAKIVLGYTKSYFADGVLSEMVTDEKTDAIELSTGATIEIATNSFRNVRGRTIALAIFDELAFWRDEASASPDKEIYRAVMPGLATLPGAMLVMISSPYRKNGLLFEKHRKHYGKPGDDVLVIVAPSIALNPTLDQRMIVEAMEDDPAAASAEWLAQFRNDIENFVSREVVDAAIVTDRHELRPLSSLAYFAFTDPSGGSADSFTLAIAHRDKDGSAILDAVRERRPPFSPEAVVTDFAELLKSYGIAAVIGDRYAGEWPRERFRVHGIEYKLAEKPKSDIYRDVLPMLNSGKVELLDHPRLTAQLCGLERRTSRGGRDSIDHAPGGHDDIANAAAGALVAVASAAAPAMWHRDALMVSGSPVDPPKRCDAVFATMVASLRGEIAVIYFARTRVTGTPLILLDLSISPLAPALFHEIATRLTELAQAHRAKRGALPLFCPEALAEEARRRGFAAEPIDTLISAGEDLALGAAAHIAASRVKITAAALANADHHPLGGILDANASADDPLRVAALCGIALALDEGRSMSRAA